MKTLSFSTHFATPEEAKKEWVVVDATDQIVGRLCSKVAKILHRILLKNLKRWDVHTRFAYF